MYIAVKGDFKNPACLKKYLYRSTFKSFRFYHSISVGHNSTQSSASNTPATLFVTLLKHAVTLLITLLRNSLLYSKCGESNGNFKLKRIVKKK